MAFPTDPIYKLVEVTIGGITSKSILKAEPNNMRVHFGYDEENIDYQQYLEDLKIHGMSIVSCDDCGDGAPDKSMWQYLDNAEELLVNKYGSDQDKLTALREDRYVRAMEAKTPYESMTVAGSVIDNTPQIIKDKYRHLPMRR